MPNNLSDMWEVMFSLVKVPVCIPPVILVHLILPIYCIDYLLQSIFHASKKFNRAIKMIGKLFSLEIIFRYLNASSMLYFSMRDSYLIGFCIPLTHEGESNMYRHPLSSKLQQGASQAQPFSEQPTQPLARLQESFPAYRLRHRLTWLEIARAAGVPCLVVWSIDHGLTVHPTHADLVRQGLKRLTGGDDLS